MPAPDLVKHELTSDFFDRPVCDVARELVGCALEHAGTSGLIVEVEAYHQSEPACHGYIGETPRNAALFGPPAHAYVYLSYGVHDMLNFVTGPIGEGAAVLVRALEPLAGIDLMRKRRGVEALRDLCLGPGKLAQALDVGPGLNRVPLPGGPLTLRGRSERPKVIAGPRVGITKATDLPWRFSLAGSRFVSRPRPAQ